MNKASSWITIVIVTLLTFGASVVVTLAQPMEYRSSFTLLVIENNQSLDGYAASKSAERLSMSLGNVINTGSFADKVYEQLKDNAEFKGNPLVSDEAQVRREEWKKRIETKTMPDVGQVKISVYQENDKQAESIANTLSISIVALAADYLGGGKDVKLKIVDYPLTTKYPVRPNIPANLAAGILVGLGGSLGFQFLRSLRPHSAQPPQPTVRRQAAAGDEPTIEDPVAPPFRSQSGDDRVEWVMP